MKLSEKVGKFADNLDKTGKGINRAGNKMTKKVTLPIILFILGAATFPIGIIFWLIAIFLIAS